MKSKLIQKTGISMLLMGFVVLFSGCPFSGSVPIDNGTVAIADQLNGEWIKPTDLTEENPTTYMIRQGDDKYHAVAEKSEYSTDDAEYNTTVYNLTFSNVSGETFMSAQEAGTTTYYYYKFAFNKETKEISITEVSDYIKETFNTSEELKSFIANYKQLSFFFTNTTDTYQIRPSDK
ncbi:MAG TPA: hypothetical protein PLJ84_00060 [Bacteroidales bacterium]|nr:hypothetical protein [Bacteroidales bacterium]HPT00962.1 hypothetical protein [Bacteroidales bacterium]